MVVETNFVLAVVGILSGIVGMVMSIFVYFDKRETTKQGDMVSKGDYILDTNQAIILANKRALDAEKRIVEIEGKYEAKLKEINEKHDREISDLKERVMILEGNLCYKIELKTVLGTNPQVKSVVIEHVPDCESIEQNEKK